MAYPIDDALRSEIGSVIQQLRQNIRWKPGKDIAHLRTRQAYGHLPDSAHLESYEAIIRQVLSDRSAQVYVYRWNNSVIYPTVVTTYKKQYWLVMFSLDGVMETAFPPHDAQTYLENERFMHLGTLEDLVP